MLRCDVSLYEGRWGDRKLEQDRSSASALTALRHRPPDLCTNPARAERWAFSALLTWVLAQVLSWAFCLCLCLSSLYAIRHVQLIASGTPCQLLAHGINPHSLCFSSCQLILGVILKKAGLKEVEKDLPASFPAVSWRTILFKVPPAAPIPAAVSRHCVFWDTRFWPCDRIFRFFISIFIQFSSKLVY